jgi:K+-transporting ATPase KdpF subunit
MWVKDFDAFHMSRDRRATGGRQERVNACQGGVNTAYVVMREALTGEVIENVVAGVLAVALLGYLVYALLRPEKF